MASGAALAIGLILQIMGSPMHNQTKTDSKGPTGLEREQFWNEPLMQKSTSLFGFKLLTDVPGGMFIDTPDKVYLDRHHTVPLIGFRVGDTEKLRKYSFHTTARLILSHLETGVIRIAKPGLAPPPGHKKPPASPGKVVQDVEVDLIRFMAQDQKLGRFAAIMICGPESSNQSFISLYPGEKAEGTMEFENQLQDLRTQGGPPLPILAGETLDLRHEGAPAGEGSAWKLSLLKDPGGDRIRLEYRMEVPPRLVYAADKPPMDESGKRILANLPVTLVGFNENRKLVLKKDLGLPVPNPPAGDPKKPLIQGSVSLSIAKLLGNPSPFKGLHLWALALDSQSHIEIPMADH